MLKLTLGFPANVAMLTLVYVASKDKGKEESMNQELQQPQRREQHFEIFHEQMTLLKNQSWRHRTQTLRKRRHPPEKGAAEGRH